MFLLCLAPDSVATRPECHVWIWVPQSQVSSMTAEFQLPVLGGLWLAGLGLGCYLFTLMHLHSSLWLDPGSRQFTDPMSRNRYVTTFFSLNPTFTVLLNYKFLGNLTSKPIEFANLFWWRVQFVFPWLIHILDLYRTFLKSGRQWLPAFPKSFVRFHNFISFSSINCTK